MKKTLLILSTLFLSLIGFSQTFTDGYFTYNIISPSEVSLNDYDMAGGTDVTIPATVSYDAVTYDITYIGYQAFMSNELTSVTIPEGVTNIVNGAFLFNNLSTVTIPNSVTSIWEAAFASNELTSVILGENVTTIAANAFNGNLLTTIDLPAGVTSIAKQVFANNSFTDLIIPNGITEIGEGSFSGNPLTSVTSINAVPPNIVTGMGIADSFAEDRSDICLYIPIGTEGLYVTDPGAEWIGFKSFEETTFAGTPDFYMTDQFNIFPNPVNSQFTVISDFTIESLMILNSNGRVVETIINPSSSIDVSNLAQGVYILQIQTVKGLSNKKFIKN
ncbi:MAG: leucine-rich repeat protein [Crocinitomix sp.]|nr:leucine-rich repeat protein [Crocinitomix sp.]